jgi:hypothetical protein
VAARAGRARTHDPGRASRDGLAALVGVQIVGQGLGRRIAAARILFQAFETNRLQVLGNPGIELLGRRRFLGDHLTDGGQEVAVLERRLAGQAHVQDRSQAVHVRRGAYPFVLAIRLLGCHVARRSHDDPGGRASGLAQPLGQAKIADLRRPRRVQKNIGRLQVAVDHPGGVSRLDRLSQGPNQGGRVVGPKRLTRKLLVQTAARAVLQRDERQAVVFTDFVHPNHVGVLQAGHGFGLGAEAFARTAAGVLARED